MTQNSISRQVWTLPPLCVLSPPDRAPAAAASALAALLAAGIRWVQLRIKGGNDADALAAARRLLALAPPGALVTINDRLDLALLAGATSLHLGDRDLPLAPARRLFAGQIGMSTHSAAEADSASSDYVALGPIFSSPTKAGLREPLGVEAIRQARRSVPLVAIGGIGFANIESTFRAGASAVAVISDVWRTPDPVATAVRLQGACERLVGRP